MVGSQRPRPNTAHRSTGSATNGATRRTSRRRSLTIVRARAAAAAEISTNAATRTTSTGIVRYTSRAARTPGPAARITTRRHTPRDHPVTPTKPTEESADLDTVGTVQPLSQQKANHAGRDIDMAEETRPARNQDITAATSGSQTTQTASTSRSATGAVHEATTSAATNRNSTCADWSSAYKPPPRSNQTGDLPNRSASRRNGARRSIQ